jgi:hypothetical protein
MCPHIDRYYANFSQPIKVFWTVNVSDLPSNHKIEYKLSKAGDDCHYNIVGLSKRQSEKYFRKQQVEAHKCKTCDHTVERTLTVADLKAIRDSYPPIGRPPEEK